MVENANSIEIVIFNYFWLREYRRRNNGFIKGFNSLLSLAKKELNKKKVIGRNIIFEVKSETLSLILHILKTKEYADKFMKEEEFSVSADLKNKFIDKEIIKAINSFAKKYKLDKRNLPKSTEGFSAELILDWVLDGKPVSGSFKDNPLLDLTTFAFEFYYEYQDMIFKEGGVKVKRNSTFEANEILLEINLDKPLETILEGVTYYCAFHKLRGNSEECVDPDKVDETFDKASTDSSLLLLCDYLKHFIGKNRARKYKVTDRPRAIGLWLWEYMENNSCKKDTEAFRAFKEYELKKQGSSNEDIKKFWESRKKRQATTKLDYEFRSLRRYLNNTTECIEEMKVLNIARS